MALLHGLAATIGVFLTLIAAGYEWMAVMAVVIWKSRRTCALPDSTLEAVTLLKPLCGAEPGLYVNLRSFCLQDYPHYQIVFGVQDEADPALAIVSRLIHEFPGLDIQVVINAQQHGSNRKISSLINMIPKASHSILLIADSDALVGPHYLASMAAPLNLPGVGLVTCIYRGTPTSTIWSRLGAMYVNEWYMPSVLLASLFGHRDYASGLTLCLRRDTLHAVGGLRRLANHLADDYELGSLIRGAGLRIALSTYVPQTEHSESSLDDLIEHEIRWMRAIRALRPRSFQFLFLSFCLPLATLGLVMCEGLPAAVPIGTIAFALALFGRLAIFGISKFSPGRFSLLDLLLLPSRDLLLCWVWMRALRTSRITWRGNQFAVDAQGIMRGVS